MTPWTLEVWRIWLQTASTTAILLGVGCVAVALCRSPVRQARLAVLTLAGCLVAPILGLVPGVPRWSVLASSPSRADRGDDPEPVRSVAPAGPEQGPIALEPAQTVNRTETGELSPTPTDKPLRLTTIDPRAMILAAHWLGASAWVGCWCVGHWVLLRVVRSARPVPAEVHARFLAIAGPSGAGVRLLETDRVRLPITFTWLRPTIILPLDLARDRGEELRFALAHEWSHVERGDYLSWTFASMLGTLVFFNPCYWYLRRQLRLSQDYLADDRAAATGAPLDFASHLVRLARSRRAEDRFPLPALGIDGWRSQLGKRVAMLVRDRPPLETRCRPIWTSAVVVLAATALVVVSVVRLEAKSQPEPAKIAVATAGPEVGRECRAKVVNQVSGEPVVGIAVHVKVSHYHDRARGILTHRELDLMTATDGSYRVKLTDEEALDPSMSVLASVDSPDFIGGFRSWTASERPKDLKPTVEPIDVVLKLRPASPVEGVVLTPDGGPAADVKVRGYSTSSLTQSWENSIEQETRTDVQGRFRLPLQRTGPANIRLLPDQFEPAMYPLENDKRGDLGTIRLRPGAKIKGRVVDVAGKPIGGVYVLTNYDPNSESPNSGFRWKFPWQFGQPFGRVGRTLDDGTFALPPVPPGDYRIEPVSTWNSFLVVGSEPPEERPLPATFLPKEVVVEPDKEPQPITLQAVPHVVLSVQMLTTLGKKGGGPGATLDGWVGREPWRTSHPAATDGSYRIFVPKGLSKANLFIPTLLEWDTKPLTSSKTVVVPTERDGWIKLGSLDQDKSLEVTRFLAPTIIVKAFDNRGRMIENLKTTMRYVNPADPDPRRGGPNLHALFDSFFQTGLDDPRKQTFHTAVDREVEITAWAEGFARASRNLTLSEGQTEEVAFVLEPK